MEGNKMDENKMDDKEKLRAHIAEIQEKNREAQEAMAQGRGILALETPILARDKEVTELQYDFTDVTGLEYVTAMDSDLNANASQAYRITYRQALALFASAAAKHTEDLDAKDIVGRIGITDAAVGAQLATLFFTASARAGRLRISKKS